MFDRLKRWASLATRRMARWTLAEKSRTFRAMLRRLTYQTAFTERDYRNFAMEAYEKNPYVYAAIRETAQACASIPPKLYRVDDTSQNVRQALSQRERKTRKGYAGQSKMRRVASSLIDREARSIMEDTGLGAEMSRERAKRRLVDQGDLEPIDSHELLDLLQRPNPWTDRSYEQFIHATVTHLEIGGEVLWEPIYGGGNPRELYALAPQDLRLVKGGPERPISEIIMRRDGSDVRFRYEPDQPQDTEIFFVRYFHPRHPFRGMSPVQAAARSIDINNEGRNWNLSLLQNGAQLSGIITAKDDLTDAQTASLRTQFKEQYAGSDNAGKVVAIGGAEGIGWEPTAANPKEMQWADLNKASAREVAIVFGTPPEILGDATQKTYSNFKEARQAFYKEKVVPTQNLIYGELNTSLVALFDENLYLDYDLSRVDALQEDVGEMHQRVREDLKAGILKINEARAKLGEEEVDGGDVILTPGTSVPLQAAGSGGDETALSAQDYRALVEEYGGAADAVLEAGSEELAHALPENGSTGDGAALGGKPFFEGV